MKAISIKSYILVLFLLILSIPAFCQDDDQRMKIRLGFTSNNDIHRQILVTVDSNTTPGIDFGYDAENFENHTDDMYWMIEDRKFLIQGINDIDTTTVLPIGIHTNSNGNNTISIEELKNVPDNLQIGILDKHTKTYYNLRDSASIYLHISAGEYLNRFELLFANSIIEASTTNDNEEITTSENEIEASEIHTNIDDIAETEEKIITLNYINRIQSISIKNIGHQIIKSVNVYSINGQLITVYNNINAIDQALIKTHNINPGNYILLLTTDTGRVTKKVLVK